MTASENGLGCCSGLNSDSLADSRKARCSVAQGLRAQPHQGNSPDRTGRTPSPSFLGPQPAALESPSLVPMPSCQSQGPPCSKHHRGPTAAVLCGSADRRLDRQQAKRTLWGLPPATVPALRFLSRLTRGGTHKTDTLQSSSTWFFQQSHTAFYSS